LIKYIVHTTTSNRDLNGNCYHFARITSTKTGKSIVIDGVGGDSNAAGLLLRRDEKTGKSIAKNWNEVHTYQTFEPKREWQRMNKFANGFNGSDISGKIYEWKVTPQMLRALNRTANPGQESTHGAAARAAIRAGK